MLEVKDISKTYSTKSGLRDILLDINFKLNIGENLGILGSNGAGKSTLLRIIAGIEAPDSGRVVIRDSNVSWPLGFSGGVNSQLTGEENSRFVARIYGADIDEIVDSTFNFSELKDYFYMPVWTYSAGMRSRLSFALSMSLQFDIYLVDEITAVGDAQFQAKCAAAFAKRRKSASVLMVSHNMNTIRRFCEKCAVLKNGRLSLYDSIDEAVEVYAR